MTEYTQHPLSAAYPAMSDEALAELADDIQDNGLREPIVVLDGMVLDGWHRYLACMAVNVTPETVEFNGADARKFVISKNGTRRHLTASQKAAAIVKVFEWKPPHRERKGAAAAPFSGEEGEPEKNGDPGSPFSDAESKPEEKQGVSGERKGAAAAPFLDDPNDIPFDDPETMSNDELAAEAGVSKRTIQQAKNAERAGLGDQVRDGTLSAEQADALAKGKDPEKAKKPTRIQQLEAKVARLEEENADLREQNSFLNDELDNYRNASMSEQEQQFKFAQLRQQVRALESQGNEYQARLKESKREAAALRRRLGAK